MSDYRRVFVNGGCYFFTVVTADRRVVFDNEVSIALLRDAIRAEKLRRPFEIDAMVVLPNHLHCIWRLPDGDADFSQRWRQIKRRFSMRFGEQIWQRSFWEHTIRDEYDWQTHMDYIHYNPVRHGYVDKAEDWQWSSYRKWRACGYYSEGWGKHEPNSLKDMCLE